jgi:hypothetical protein
MTMHITEQDACNPFPIRQEQFNIQAALPYGLQIAHVQSAMQDFIDFLGFINTQLVMKGTPRIELMVMPANFSSIVGEFISTSIPKYCTSLVRNRHHNGHPDLVPVGYYANDDVLHGAEGIEVKASRYGRGWQGHNPEDIWLMVFVFDSNRARDIQPKRFRFISVFGASLMKEDWSFSGRSGNSRRTITASVTPSGFAKMTANWIYRD